MGQGCTDDPAGPDLELPPCRHEDWWLDLSKVEQAVYDAKRREMEGAVEQYIRSRHSAESNVRCGWPCPLPMCCAMQTASDSGDGAQAAREQVQEAADGPATGVLRPPGGAHQGPGEHQAPLHAEHHDGPRHEGLPGARPRSQGHAAGQARPGLGGAERRSAPANTTLLSKCGSGSGRGSGSLTLPLCTAAETWKVVDEMRLALIRSAEPGIAELMEERGEDGTPLARGQNLAEASQAVAQTLHPEVDELGTKVAWHVTFRRKKRAAREAAGLATPLEVGERPQPLCHSAWERPAAWPR